MKERLKIWIVCTDTPSLKYGGSVRNFYIRRGLEKRAEVTTFSTDIAFTVCPPKTLLAKRNKLNVWVTLNAIIIFRVFPYMLAYKKAGVSRLILKQLEIESPRAILIEGINAYFMISNIIPDLHRKGIKIIFDAHNVEAHGIAFSIKSFPWYKRVIGLLIQKRIAYIEKEAIYNADMIFACSQNDARFMSYNSVKIPIVIPNGADISRIRPSNSTQNSGLLFMGALDYTPNEIGLRFFLEEVYPRISNKPAVNIIGKNPSKWLKEKSNDNPQIQLLGFVDDVVPYLEKASLCICPILNGSGTRLKILEYMSAGKAVVSTSVGAEGIAVKHDLNIMIADTAQDFENAINELLMNRNKSRKIGINARQMVVDNYDWEKIGEHALVEIENLIGNLNK